MALPKLNRGFAAAALGLGMIGAYAAPASAQSTPEQGTKVAANNNENPFEFLERLAAKRAAEQKEAEEPAKTEEKPLSFSERFSRFGLKKPETTAPTQTEEKPEEKKLSLMERLNLRRGALSNSEPATEQKETAPPQPTEAEIKEKKQRDFIYEQMAFESDGIDFLDLLNGHCTFVKAMQAPDLEFTPYTTEKVQQIAEATSAGSKGIVIVSYKNGTRKGREGDKDYDPDDARVHQNLKWAILEMKAQGLPVTGVILADPRTDMREMIAQQDFTGGWEYLRGENSYDNVDSLAVYIEGSCVYALPILDVSDLKQTMFNRTKEKWDAVQKSKQNIKDPVDNRLSLANE